MINEDLYICTGYDPKLCGCVYHKGLHSLVSACFVRTACRTIGDKEIVCRLVSKLEVAVYNTINNNNNNNNTHTNKKEN